MRASYMELYTNTVVHTAASLVHNTHTQTGLTHAVTYGMLTHTQAYRCGWVSYDYFVNTHTGQTYV